jgi:hypothetical protein
MIRVFLVVRVRVARDRDARAALRANDAFKKHAYVLLAARKIKTPNEYRAPRIAFASSNGIRPQGKVQILRIVERSDRTFHGLIGRKICTVPKDNVDIDGDYICVEFMLYESDPLFICGAEPRLWCWNAIAFCLTPFRRAFEAVCARRWRSRCRPLERDRTESQGLYLCPRDV